MPIRRPAALLLPAALLASPVQSQAPGSPTTASLRGLSVAPDGGIWASGMGGTVLRSTDRGSSWELHAISDARSLDLRDIEAISSRTAYAMVAGPDTARIYRTVDAGQSWERQYDDTRKGVFLDGIAFWDSTRGIAVGDPIDGRFMVLRTDDAGAHWTQLPAAASPQALPGEAAFAASGTAIVVTAGGHTWIGTGGGATARVFRSSDYGQTWSVRDTPIPAAAPSAGVFSLAFRDSLAGIAVGGDYVNPNTRHRSIAVTADGGRSWRLADSAASAPYLSGVAFLHTSSAAIAGVGTAGIFESADAGESWACRDSASFNAIAALGDSAIAVGDHGRVMAWRFGSEHAAAAAWRPSGAQATAPHAMIATSSDPASRAGIDILRRGGNAVDAAVAVGFALAVTLPAAGNIGGGGFMVLRLAHGQTATLDFREVAPRAAKRDMYLDSAGHVTDKSRVGHLAVAVPGSVAGLVEALHRYGKLPLREVMAPAIRLARDGFPVDSALVRNLSGARSLVGRFDGAAIFLPGGAPLAPGTVLRQPALARTLERIARQGASAFYRGPIAEQIVAEMRRGGGIITRADLAAYRPRWRTPLSGTYRGYGLITMPLPSSGGVALLESLNILEARGSAAPFGSAAREHMLAEAFRRAFMDRNTQLGDPEFVSAPVRRLTSKSYAAGVAASIDPIRASPSPAFDPAMPGSTHTTSYSVADAAGNVVVVTTTLNSSYGSGVYLRDGGFFLNNEMDDFAAAPGHPNQFGLIEGEHNAVAPGKRMLSSMTPTIVLDSAGAPLLMVGAAGGPTIITAVAQVILDVLDFRMPLAQAVAAPRIHHQAWPDSLVYEHNGFPAAVLDSLQVMGYRLAPHASIATLNAVMRGPQGYVGVAEPRYSRAGAAGY